MSRAFREITILHSTCVLPHHLAFQLNAMQIVDWYTLDMCLHRLVKFQTHFAENRFFRARCGPTLHDMRCQLYAIQIRVSRNVLYPTVGSTELEGVRGTEKKCKKCAPYKIFLPPTYPPWGLDFPICHLTYCEKLSQPMKFSPVCTNQNVISQDFTHYDIPSLKCHGGIR